MSDLKGHFITADNLAILAGDVDELKGHKQDTVLVSLFMPPLLSSKVETEVVFRKSSESHKKHGKSIKVRESVQSLTKKLNQAIAADNAAVAAMSNVEQKSPAQQRIADALAKAPKPRVVTIGRTPNEPM